MTNSSKKQNIINGRPSFFYDNSDKDESEILIDYFLSWTIRCTVDGNNNVNPKVKEYSKRILLKFLEGEGIFSDISTSNINVSDVEFLEVKTHKQWERIDVDAEVIVKYKKVVDHFAILFENKLYTHVHDDQLKRYQEVFDSYYRNVKEKSHYKKVYVFLTCLEEVEGVDEQACNEAKFKHFTFQELRDVIGADGETGDALFDEFWFRYY